MSKVKYYYDSETLSYRRIEQKKGRKFGIAALGVISAFLAGFILLLIYLNIPQLETPKEKAYKRELENMQLQYDLMNQRLKRDEDILKEIAERDDNIYRLYFGANPIPEELRNAGFGGVNRYKSLEGFDNSDIIIESSERIDKLTKQIVVQSKSLDEIASLAEKKEELLATIPAIQPIQNSDLRRMASGYGWRSDPFTKARKFHYGMDFSANTGTPVYASGTGVVTRADANSSGYGKHIRIDHGFNYVSLYAHLSKYNVEKGQKVNRGDVIGYVGSTGRSVAPHLHYEIFKDGERINPRNFYYGSLTSEEFSEMLKASNLINETLD
ncbi:murein DD-endopeptidase MepM/ murein hydrolase activator NlpD [Aquimarina sp. EL_43]|uniref:M23 family metallopeptidase n=1 Tax=Aquimarina TaxID=290174 RepID=UPI000471C529|nr:MULTISPECIES: M23 family metallopeptidase [Aquimarina]MBG6130114.1 murein DD-endopeptidase MepM/ murein hydrolase activator NlpD [Aquimarina sp. EL_35]MBG6148894.1 murein DD-endopeptidase MepM/ murein hydrolase activator NlpD [Aquimarina sp. EL_32]MBG6168732.1 murein DD-endopeptidase MepM/ murein hydrolase activator NlpD [Aquimarina sp. EL_43]